MGQKTEARFRALLNEIEQLNNISQTLSWDMRVMMPPSAAPYRSEEMGYLAQRLHVLQTSDETEELLLSLARHSACRAPSALPMPIPWTVSALAWTGWKRHWRNWNKKVTVSDNFYIISSKTLLYRAFLFDRKRYRKYNRIELAHIAHIQKYFLRRKKWPKKSAEEVF